MKLIDPDIVRRLDTLEAKVERHTTQLYDLQAIKAAADAVKQRKLDLGGPLPPYRSPADYYHEERRHPSRPIEDANSWQFNVMCITVAVLACLGAAHVFMTAMKWITS